MVYQVPPEAPSFVDREDEQARAFRAAAEWDEASRPLCLALSGTGGSGKTELAFRIARTLRESYPDHVLYVDLDDLRRQGAVEAADVLGDLLRSLGVEPQCLGHSLLSRGRQYWEKTRDARLVVIVDNARFGSEVLPLFPASGASLVIVTSHAPLRDLPSGAAVEVTLDPLPDPYARDLLRAVVDADDPRLDAEPEAVAGLVRLCSGLPAAVHVAGRWMRGRRRRPLARLLADFSTELNERGLPVVERVWDAAYQGLSPRAALLYRLLSGFPGRSFTLPAAAALLGLGREAADEALEDLENAGLLDARAERIRLPELSRAHARRCAARDGGEDELADAQRRIVRWYLRQAQRADAAAAGTRLTLAEPVGPLPDAPDVPFDEPAGEAEAEADAERGRRALRWLEAERHALHGCVAIASARGLLAEAWALCEPLWTLHLDHPHYADAIEAFRAAVDAALRAGHVPALVRMRCQLARPLWEQERWEEAERELELAFNAAKALGDSTSTSNRDRKLAASVVEFRGTLRAARGDWTRAAADFETALRAHAQIGNAYGVMLLTYRQGQALVALGEPHRAAELLERAYHMAGELGRERMTARTGVALGGVLRRLGRSGQVRELYETALASARGRGSGHDEMRILAELVELAEETGDEDAARRHREAAHAIRERNGLLGGGGEGAPAVRG